MAKRKFEPKTPEYASASSVSNSTEDLSSGEVRSGTDGSEPQEESPSSSPLPEEPAKVGRSGEGQQTAMEVQSEAQDRQEDGDRVEAESRAGYEGTGSLTKRLNRGKWKAESELGEEVTSVWVQNDKGKEKVDEDSKDADCVPLSPDSSAEPKEESEKSEDFESDEDYLPSSYGESDNEELPDEGTSKRPEKRKVSKPNTSNNRGVVAEEYGNRKPLKASIEECEMGKQKNKKRTMRKREEDAVDMNGEDAEWINSLHGSHLSLMVSLRDLGAERVKTLGKESLYSCLSPAALRTIGVILEEHVKERYLSLMDSCEVTGSFPESLQEEGNKVIGDDEAHGEEKRESSQDPTSHVAANEQTDTNLEEQNETGRRSHRKSLPTRWKHKPEDVPHSKKKKPRTHY